MSTPTCGACSSKIKELENKIKECEESIASSFQQQQDDNAAYIKFLEATVLDPVKCHKLRTLLQKKLKI